MSGGRASSNRASGGEPLVSVDQAAASVLLSSDDYFACLRFDSVKFSEFDLVGKTFEDCEFASCHFNGMSLSRSAFVSCAFCRCELVLAKLDNTTLNSVHFRGSKLVGLNFEPCNKFGFLPDFEDCLIESSVFCANNLKKGRFESCVIRDSDFMECDLRDTTFGESSLESSTFQKCNLERADFRSALNYSIDPLNNRLANARFTLPEAQSFLGFLGIKLD